MPRIATLAACSIALITRKAIGRFGGGLSYLEARNKSEAAEER